MMSKNIFTLFLTWLLTVQAALAFSPRTASNSKIEARKYIDAKITEYNAFAANPNISNLPRKISSDQSEVIKDYFIKNKITGSLPLAKITAAGTIELTIKGQSTVLEINPALGTISMDGDTLVLKPDRNFKGYFKQIEKFLTMPKTANHNVNSSAIGKTIESLLSLVVPIASADCLGKYDAVIDAKMPERKGYYKTKHPAVWVLATGILLAVLLMPGSIAGLPAIGGYYGSIYVNDKDSDIKREENRVINEIYDIILIDGALRVAKTGKVPSERITDEEPYNPDHFRFFDLYSKYSEIAKKQNTTPLSKEDFLKVLAEGDASEKFCSPNVIETANKFAEKITLPEINPNIVNKNVESVTEIVDEGRKDAPKQIPDIEVEQKGDSSNAVSK